MPQSTSAPSTREFRQFIREFYPRPSRLPLWVMATIGLLWLLPALLNFVWFARTIPSAKARAAQSLSYSFLFPIWHIDQQPATVFIGNLEVPRAPTQVVWILPAALCGLALYLALAGGDATHQNHRAEAERFARQQGRLPPWELPALLFLKPGESGVPLAKVGHGKRERIIGIVQGTSRGHALCVAPTGAGKGLHLTDLMLTWHGPAVIVDPKGEIYRRTATHRRMLQGLGPCYNLPHDALDLLDSFDPHDPLDVQALHEILLETWRDREPIWAKKTLPLFFAAMAAGQATGRNGLQILARWAQLALPDAMTEAAVFAPREVRQFLDSLPPEKALENKFASSAWGTFTAKFATFAPHIGTFTQRDVPPDWVEASSTIYITYPLEQASTARPLVAAAVAGLIRGRMRQAQHNRTATPTLFLIDELAAFAIPGLDTLLATVRSAGIMLILYLQQLSQLRDIYGPETAETIMGNCHYHLYFASNDLKMARHISDMLGTRLDFIRHESKGRSHTVGQANRTGQQTTISHQRQEVPALSPAEAQKRLPDDAVVVYAPMGKRKGIVIARRLDSSPLFDELEHLPRTSTDHIRAKRAVDLATPLVPPKGKAEPTPPLLEPVAIESKGPIDEATPTESVSTDAVIVEPAPQAAPRGQVW
ncbi:MAG: type IV secretory system conjugative DNA transfer family protein [Herpetosiphonaceae bacterium]|nr:type IV secretory system conjugative DNA transfer family protein [Herpetosiphonaceae bacterium]